MRSMFQANHLLGMLLMSLSLSIFAAGDPEKGKKLSTTCVACHSTDGNSPSDAFPKIAGQHESYIFKQLKNIKSGKRKAPLMTAIVAPLSEQDMQDLGAYFAKQTVSKNIARANKEVLRIGENIYRDGDHNSNIPSCAACHGPQGKGNAKAKFPAIHGQYAAYTIQQLKAFRQDALNHQLNDSQKAARENDTNKIMRQVSQDLTDTQIHALAQYIAGLH